MAVRQENVMPLSLVVQDPAKLKQHPHDGVSFELDENSARLPLVVATIEDDQNHDQSVQVTFGPDQLDALIEELKGLQRSIQWQMAQSHWQFVRYNSRSKWHLRLKRHAGGQLCTTRPRYEPTAIEVIDAGATLWHENVCTQCVQLWTQQIHSGWIRYQYAYQPPALSTQNSPTTNESKP